MSERRHEWTDPETGATVWLAEKRMEMDTHGVEIDNVFGVFAYYAHHLAALLDAKDAALAEAREATMIMPVDKEADDRIRKWLVNRERRTKDDPGD